MTLTPKQLAALRNQLNEIRQDVTAQLQTQEKYGLDDAMRDSTSELSMADNHPADIGTELFERGKDLALSGNARHQLEEVTDALKRIDEGSYGSCAVCGSAIPYERLEAIPWARACIAHAEQPGVTDDRPIEEELISSPLNPAGAEVRRDETEFDGEDAWQAVERYGSSTSPAYADNPDTFDYEHPEMNPDEHRGYVESLESFLATDLHGNARFVIRNSEYHKYMENEEGDHGLETDQ